MKRDSFIFYRSFMEAMIDLPPKEYKVVMQAIQSFALDGIETNLTGVSKVVFTLVKPQIQANNARYKNGCQGGRPKNQSETEEEPNYNQSETELKPNQNQTITKVKPNDNQTITKPKPNHNQSETKPKPNDNDNVNDNVNVNENNNLKVNDNLKEEINKEEKSSSFCSKLNLFLNEFNIGLDTYSANIEIMDFDLLSEMFRNSEWLKRNISSFGKVCELYPKIISGYYKNYDSREKKDGSWECMKNMLKEAQEQEGVGL